MVHLSVANFTLSLEKEKFSHRTGKHYVLKTLEYIMNVLHRLLRQKITPEVHGIWYITLGYLTRSHAQPPIFIDAS